MDSTPSEIPILDVAPLISRGDPTRVAQEIRRACRDHGFFYVVGHDVDQNLCARLHELSRRFFTRDREAKMAIRMARGGRAWRGYFPVGAELTKGRPDAKEGLYFGAELAADHPAVVAGTPLHGANLFPDLPGFRETVLDYMAALTRLGHALMEGIAVSLGLEPTYFADRYTRDPLVLFRIFNYPALAGPSPAGLATGSDPEWSVAEHTDYGLLTILWQDDAGGLQVKTRRDWAEAPPVEGSFVCNIGDMLDRMTGGHYRSTPHRVRNPSGTDRLSFPFFFDPNFDADVRPIDPEVDVVDDSRQRWDGASVHDFQGTYGDYLLAKVAKVFPELGRDI